MKKLLGAALTLMTTIGLLPVFVRSVRAAEPAEYLSGQAAEPVR